MAQQYQVRFVPVPRWLAVLIGVAGVAIAVALLLLSLTLALVIVPVLAIVGGLYYLFGQRRSVRKQREDFQVIEGEYRVLEPGRAEDKRDRP
jgi:hypothetical protein